MLFWTGIISMFSKCYQDTFLKNDFKLKSLLIVSSIWQSFPYFTQNNKSFVWIRVVKDMSLRRPIYINNAEIYSNISAADKSRNFQSKYNWSKLCITCQYFGLYGWKDIRKKKLNIKDKKRQLTFKQKSTIRHFQMCLSF